MGKIKIAGLIVGLVGNGLMAYALYTLLGGAGCATSLDPSPCEAAMTPGMIALPAGIILSMVGIFMGGGFYVFSGLFIAIGLGSMAASAFTDMGEMQSFGWLFGGMFAFFGILPLLLSGVVKGKVAARQVEAQRLIQTGRKGIGTILAVNDTGLTINENPRVEIVMRVEPVDGSPPLELRKKVIVSRVALPRAGDRHPVWYDPADHEKWAFGTDMDASAPREVRELFDLVRQSAGARPESGNMVDELERLNALHSSGALTDREFAEAKERLLRR